MAATAVQSRLNFQIRKSSRSSAKSDENSEIKVSPKRKLNVDLHESSPGKKSKPLITDSPSTMLSGLTVGPDERCSILDAESRLAPVRLFPPNVSSYKAARRALHSGIPNKLQCRENEINKLNEFLFKTLVDQQTGSLYISGPPGTGKTASLTHVLQNLDGAKFEQVWVNCMALKSSASIYEQIARGFGLKTSLSERALQIHLEDFFTEEGPKLLVVLDELDQLSCKFQSILYSLFEYPALAGSRLVLVGISNALDLTDRLLPRLQTKLMAKSRPELLNFAPYNKQQLATIINERLQEACTDGSQQVIKPAAVLLLSVKIASVAGDARKALDIARRAIDMAEAEARKQTTLRTTADDGQNPNSPRKNRPGAPVKCVDPVLIMKVFNQVYGSRVAPASHVGGNSDDGFPVQQKIVLCTLLLFTKSSKQKEPTVGKSCCESSKYETVSLKKASRDESGVRESLTDRLLPRLQTKLMAKSRPELLNFAPYNKQQLATIINERLQEMHEVYCQVCRKRNVTPVDQSEFWSLCGLLESRGFLNVKKHKTEIRMAKISLRVDENEIASALRDKTLIASILDEAKSYKL